MLKSSVWSRYTKSLEPFYDSFDPQFLEVRRVVREVLQKEADLQEIVQLVGKVTLTLTLTPTLKLTIIVSLTVNLFLTTTSTLTLVTRSPTLLSHAHGLAFALQLSSFPPSLSRAQVGGESISASTELRRWIVSALFLIVTVMCRVQPSLYHLTPVLTLPASLTVSTVMAGLA